MTCRVSHSGPLTIDKDEAKTRRVSTPTDPLKSPTPLECSALLASARSSGALVQFVRRHILYVCCNVPLVSEGILKTARPVAVELILHRPYHLRTGCHSQLGLCVHVLDVEKDTHR